MKLPILKIPEYLSPSSMGEWNTCQMKFYLKRMASNLYIPNLQSYPAAVGSVFDAYVKCALAREIGHDLGEPSKIIEKNVDASLRDRAVEEGSRLFSQYKTHGCFKRLLARGIMFIELDKTAFIEDDTGSSVPIRGLPDMFEKDGRPVEVKVSGAGSKSGQSPCQGYMSCYHNGVNKGAHSKFGEPLELLNEDWAKQLVTYNWIYAGLLPWRNVDVAIEQVAIRGTTVAFATIRTFVGIPFQERVYADYKKAWQAVQEGDIQEAQPSPDRCNKWGTLCEVSTMCTKYNELQAMSPELRELRGYR